MRFHYRALQQDGRLSSGWIDAYSPRGAHRSLVKRGLQPTAIAAAAPRRRPALRRSRSLGSRDYAYLLKQMHMLLQGGVPVDEAVAELAEATDHPALAAALAALHAELRRGEPFPRALRRCFPGVAEYVHRTVEAGELTGRLGAALGDAADQLEHEARIRAELRAALTYPAILVGAGLASILFIFTFVVPRFAAMFQGRFDELPWLSWVVIASGMWLRAHAAAVLAVVGAIALVAEYGRRRPRWREATLAALSRIPVARGWIGAVEQMRWAVILAGLLENRVPLMQSLELARAALRDRNAHRQLLRVEREVRAGTALSAALGDAGFLPSLPLTLVRVGERSGNLPQMMRSIAAMYEDSVRSRMRTALALIEPAAILLLGIAIGLVAAAVFLAITSINSLPGL